MSKATQLSQSYSSPRTVDDTAAIQVSRAEVGRVLQLVSGPRYQVGATDLGSGILMANGLYANLIVTGTSSLNQLTTVQLIASPEAISSGIVVQTVGYYLPGDGGGADWKATGNTITASQTPVNLNTALLSNANGDELSLVVNVAANVRQFGAVGDGTLGVGATDDGPAVQAAIQGTDGSGGELIFPQGNYMIRTQVNLVGAFRKLKGEALAVGIPGCRLMTDVEDFEMMVLNGETYHIENLSFIGPGLTKTGAGGGIGLHIQTSSGAVQTDDARLDNCWFAGWKETALKVPRLQGTHIHNCTFEFSGNGIAGGDGTSTAEFRNNVVTNCRFFRNIRGLSIIGDPAVAANISLCINNNVANNIFDISGDAAFIGDQAGLYMNNANFNNFSDNQFVTNEYQDIIMDTCSGNSFNNTYSFRCGRQSALLTDCEDIDLSNYRVQNWNNEFGTHALNLPAIEIDGSTVSIDGVRTRIYGTAISTNAIELKNSSVVDIQRSNLIGTIGYKYAKDAGSQIEDITPTDGTFTPVISGAGTAGAQTYSIQAGSYRRTGNQVYFKLSVLLTAVDVATAGAVQIEGLPFTVQTATEESQYVVKYNDINITSSNELTASATSNTTIINLYRPLVGAGNSAFALDSSQLGDNSRFDLSGVYITNDV